MSWKHWCWYVLFGLLMLGVLAEKISRAEWTLRHGAEYKCRVEGFDPPDFLRGRYVRFRVPDFPRHPADNDWTKGKTCWYVPLTAGPDGMVEFGEPSAEMPPVGDHLKLRRARYYVLSAPFSEFYVNEHRAQAVEAALRRHGSGILTFRVWQGFAVPVELSIGGLSVKEIR